MSAQQMSHPHLSELTELIYAAVSDSSQWRTFLEACVGAVGARGATLILRDLSGQDLSMNCWCGWSEADVLNYLPYAAHDPWALGATHMPEGDVGPDTLACPREVMQASAVWKEYYAPRDLVHGMAGIILRTPTCFSAMSFLRGDAEGPFSETQLRLVGALMPHLRRAALLHGELGSLRIRLEAFAGHLDRYPHALCLLDQERRVLYANTTATEILAGGGALRIDGGRLTVATARGDKALGEAMRDGLKTRELGRFVVPQTGSAVTSKPGPRLLFLPLSGAGEIALGVAKPAVAVVILGHRSAWQPDPAVLRELFDLTRTEAAVAGQLAQGYAVHEIADKMCVSLETTRTHVRRVMAKTGTDRQAALVSLVLQSAPFRT